MAELSKAKKKTKGKAKSRPRTPRKPRNWDNAISVAYIRMIGYPKVSQGQAALQVGVSERTVRAWESAPWWAQARQEARDRFLRGGDAAAMRGILLAFQDEKERGLMSRWWAERRMPELEPPRFKHEHGGPDGGPVPVFHGLSDEAVDLVKRKIFGLEEDE